MGTTESIFYDSNEEGYPQPQSQQQQASYPSPPLNSSAAAAAAAASPSQRRTPHSTTATPPLPTASRRRRSSSQQHSGITEQPQSPPRRTNASPSQQQQQEPFQLSGTVLGLAGSGKRTLLQRLEGKEPNFAVATTSNNSSKQTSRRSSDESSSTTLQQTEETAHTPAATAPYQPPPHATTWENQIRLHVSAHTKLSKKKNDVAISDFYVVLLDPRSKRSKLEKYLTKTVRSILRMQGYGGAKNEKTENGSDDLQQAAASAQQRRRPLCLCLLRNFRDALNIDDDEDDENNNMTSESDLTSWTMQVLLDEHDFLLDPNDMVLQCHNVSLLNCYGLGQLHHFIYQAYVQRKRYDLECQLQAVVEAQTRARHASTTQNAAALSSSSSYREYCQQLEQLVGVNNRSNRRRGDDETATTATSSGRRRQVILNNNNTLPQRRRSRTMTSSSGGEEESLSTLPSQQSSSLAMTTTTNAKDALEAFLESSSSSDDSVVDGNCEEDSSENVQRVEEQDDQDDGWRVRQDYDSSQHHSPVTTTSRKEEEGSKQTEPENGSNNHDDGFRPGSEKGGEENDVPVEAERNVRPEIENTCVHNDDDGGQTTLSESTHDESAATTKNRDLKSPTTQKLQNDKGSAKKNAHVFEGDKEGVDASNDIDKGDERLPDNVSKPAIDDSFFEESQAQEKDRVDTAVAVAVDIQDVDDESDSEFFIGETVEHDGSEVTDRTEKDTISPSLESGAHQSDTQPKTGESESQFDDQGESVDNGQIGADKSEQVDDVIETGDVTCIQQAQSSDGVEKERSTTRSPPLEIPSNESKDQIHVKESVQNDKPSKEQRSEDVPSSGVSNPPAATSEISAAARAALAAAQQDFEHMFDDREPLRSKKPKKKKEEGERKKKKKKAKQKEEE